MTNFYSTATVQQHLERPTPNYGKATLYTFWRSLIDFINPWNIAFAVGLPVIMYLMFGTGQEYSTESVGHGNVAASILTSMSLYGAVITSASAGTSISVERSQGWTRQMSMTPLPSSWYILGKVLAAIGAAAIVVIVTFIIGYLTDAQMEPAVWFLTALIIILCSLTTAAMGLAIGYLMKSEAAFGVMGGGTALLAFFSGMFIPLEQMGDFFRTVAPYSPLYGINQLGKVLLYGEGSFEWSYLLNAVVWFLLFAALAWLGRSRDTARR